MNLPTEYVLRGDRVRSMLTLPCSLLLGSDKHLNEPLKGKVVLTLNKQGEQVWVCRYDLETLSPRTLPTTEAEYYVLTSEIFTSEFVILPGFKPLQFVETPYDFQGKQETAQPAATLQEKEYHATVETFYCSHNNRIAREHWLWRAFENLNCNNELRAKYFSPIPSEQQEVIRVVSPNIWKLWEGWKRMFLNFYGAATELVFHKAFGMTQPYMPFPNEEQRDALNSMYNDFFALDASANMNDFFVAAPRRRSGRR